MVTASLTHITSSSRSLVLVLSSSPVILASWIALLGVSLTDWCNCQGVSIIVSVLRTMSYRTVLAWAGYPVLCYCAVLLL